MSYINKIPILNINVPQIAFREAPAVRITAPSNPYGDSFSTNPLRENLASTEKILALARSNPRIMQILKENKIPLKVNENTLKELQNGHHRDARVVAAQMYSTLPAETKQGISMSNLQQAAMFHDIGKIFIPDSILNKQGKLTDEERKIMETHSELGYELLKDTGLNKETLALIKYHHQTPDGRGYPEIKDDFKYSTASEILRATDEYTAMREKRSYKPALSRDEALATVHEDVENGSISPEVYDALRKSTA
ncbi:HD domain-containing protein [bacterium]|nr:HD domain-containing protein [bacterium]